MIVEDSGDGVSGDHANWANATILYDDFKPQIVDGNYQSRMQQSDEVFSNKLKPLIKKLPKASEAYVIGIEQDWLVKKVDLPSGIFQGENEKEIMISNGLISRTFRLSPNCATVDFKNLVNDETLLRGVSPEAQLTINGKDYKVGGLDGQVEYGYLKKEWLDQMWSPESSFQLVDFKIEGD